MEGLIGFILAGFALAGSPGPATLSVAASASAFGARQSVPFVTGIISGMILVMILIATGVIGMMLTVPGMAPLVTTLAAFYIVYLAYRIATAPPLYDNKTNRRKPSFVGGVFLSFINPKGYAAMAALFSSFILMDDQFVLDAMIKIVVMVAVMLIVYGIWLLVGSTLTRIGKKPRTHRVMNITFAFLLLVSVFFAVQF